MLNTQVSSTALILAITGYSRGTPGIFEPDDNILPLKDELPSSWDEGNETDDNQEQGQTSDDTLGRTLTPRPAKEMQLAKDMEHLLREFQLLLNQLLLRHQGVEMDISASDLSMSLKKLQGSLAMANLRFKNYVGPDRQKIQDNLTKASQHQIDAEKLHDLLFEPTSEPSYPRP